MIVFKASIGYWEDTAHAEKFFFEKGHAQKFIDRNLSDEEWNSITEVEVHGLSYYKAKAEQLEKAYRELSEREMNLDDIADYQDYLKIKEREGKILGFEAAIYQLLEIKDGYLTYVGPNTTKEKLSEDFQKTL